MKKRDLYHSSVVRCRQNHKDFDCTENDHMVGTTIFMSDDSRSVANSNNKVKHFGLVCHHFAHTYGNTSIGFFDRSVPSALSNNLPFMFYM